MSVRQKDGGGGRDGVRIAEGERIETLHLSSSKGHHPPTIGVGALGGPGAFRVWKGRRRPPKIRRNRRLARERTKGESNLLCGSTVSTTPRNLTAVSIKGEGNVGSYHKGNETVLRTAYAKEGVLVRLSEIHWCLAEDERAGPRS